MSTLSPADIQTALYPASRPLNGVNLSELNFWPMHQETGLGSAKWAEDNGLKIMGQFGLNMETEAPVFPALISLDPPANEIRDLSLVGRNGAPKIFPASQIYYTGSEHRR